MRGLLAKISDLQQRTFSKFTGLLVKISLGTTIWSLWQEGMEGFLS